MTDTPTPAMTPDKRNLLIQKLRVRQTTISDEVADQLKADGVTIATLTAERDDARDGEKTARNLMQKAFDVNRKVIAERDAAQVEIARLTEDLTREKSEVGVQIRHLNVLSKTIATLTAERDAAQAEIARLTAALATAREDGMREALDCLPALIKSEWDEGTDSHAPNRCHLTVRENMGVRAAGSRIKAAIQKGDAT